VYWANFGFPPFSAIFPHFQLKTGKKAERFIERFIGSETPGRTYGRGDIGKT
jgi:hypothetical protein